MQKLSLALILGLGMGGLVVGCGGSSGGDATNTAPAFVSDYSISYLGESEVVFTANATDSEGDTLTYSLEGDDATYFTIDKGTGEVKFALDADDINELTEFDFMVLASDGVHTVQRPAHVSGSASDYVPNPQKPTLPFFEGRAVAQYGDYIAVGNDRLDGAAGKVFIYKKDDNDNVEYVRTITASDRAVSDHFGKSVTLNADFLIVGAPYDDDKGHNAGAAYAYHYGGTDDFGNEEKFYPRLPDANDLFGYSMDVSKDILVIGAPGKEASCFIPPEALNSVPTIEVKPELFFSEGGGGVYSFTIGVAYLETLTEPGYFTWIIPRGEVNTNCLIENGDWFGKSVAIDGEQIIIGAPYDDEKGTNAGAAYIYIGKDFSGYSKKFFGSDTNEKDNFGMSVAIDIINSDMRTVVGAPGVKKVDRATTYGAAYVFNGSGVTEKIILRENVQLIGENTLNQFGMSVAISSFVEMPNEIIKRPIAVGSPGDDTVSLNAGAVYLFDDSGTFNYEYSKKIEGNGISSPYVFGASVSLSRDSVVTGYGNITAIYTEEID